MKRVIALALAATAGAAMAQDGQVRFLGNGVANGGAFDMRAETDIAGTGIKAGRMFQTFCIELGEQIGGGVYNVRVNDGAVTGSTSPGQDTDGDAGNGKDVISSETAWLFTEFWNGGITFANDTEERGFQLAMWYFEEAIGNLNGGTLNVTATGVGSANAAQRAAAFGYIQDALNSGFQGIGKVRVINIGTVASNYDRQDMLIVIPMPQASALAGLGLLGLGVRRRRIGA